jgi:hypothetical protein
MYTVYQVPWYLIITAIITSKSAKYSTFFFTSSRNVYIVPQLPAQYAIGYKKAKTCDTLLQRVTHSRNDPLGVHVMSSASPHVQQQPNMNRR